MLQTSDSCVFWVLNSSPFYKWGAAAHVNRLVGVSEGKTGRTEEFLVGKFGNGQRWRSPLAEGVGGREW